VLKMIQSKSIDLKKPRLYLDVTYWQNYKERFSELSTNLFDKQQI